MHVSREAFRLLLALVVIGGGLFMNQSVAVAAEPKVELLWPAGAPGAKGDEEADKPTLTIWPAAADQANGMAVVVCPGGGYGGLAMDHEGVQIAQWLNKNGISAFVLKYRHAPRYQHPAPLDDAQRAIRTVRTRAAEWKVDPARIGILGFSAGGHLTSSAGTHFDAGKTDSDDKIQQASSRPDFMVLCYPVISFSTEYGHSGSLRNLLGEKPDPKLVEHLSSELQVTAETPPTFLFHTNEDGPVPAENSVLFYLALRKAKVPAEMHIYERGPHGVGLAQKDPILATWSDRCIDWFKTRGFMDAAK